MEPTPRLECLEIDNLTHRIALIPAITVFSFAVAHDVLATF